MSAHPLRICIIYDRVYPASIGGAERWYRRLAERLANEGHQVTYLTSKHWTGEAPAIPGVRIFPLLRQGAPYGRSRRRILPVLAFGLAIAWHLLRHGREYDVVHTSAMLHLTAIVAGWLARPMGYRLVLDWWEVWTWRFWTAYAGPLGGLAGWLLQRHAARLQHVPIAHSTLHARRLRQYLPTSPIPIMRGLLDETRAVDEPFPARPLVVYAGRLIPEKQAPAIVPAIALARNGIPGLRASIFGEGPDAEIVRRAIEASGLQRDIDLRGFVAEDELFDCIRAALCVILLSSREGYGLVVAEAAALGVPSIVLRHSDSAAAEHIVDGVNGFICESTSPHQVADAIVRVHRAGPKLRQDTLDWFRTNANVLTAESTIAQLPAIYRAASFAGRHVP